MLKYYRVLLFSPAPELGANSYKSLLTIETDFLPVVGDIFSLTDLDTREPFDGRVPRDDDGLLGAYVVKSRMIDVDLHEPYPGNAGVRQGQVTSVFLYVHLMEEPGEVPLHGRCKHLKLVPSSPTTASTPPKAG